MIKRELYLKQIRPYIGNDLIKVITGIRRSGKSSILMMLIDEFKESGVASENIIYINFESMEYDEITNGKELYSFIKGKIKNNNKYTILLDEIQEVESWEKAINSFLVDFNTDIYITGSNSRLLSSELATYIAGRYVEFNIFPLSFMESIQFLKANEPDNTDDIMKHLETYIRLGGFPVVHTNDYTLDEAYKIINDIYSSVLLRDVIERNNIRNIALLEKVVKFVFDNVGNIFSAKKVADYFKSQQRAINIETVYNHLNSLESAFILYRVQRYDLKGKEIMQTNEKYFLGDQGLKHAVMGYKDRDISGILENIVFLELKRRGYKVFVGRLDDKEIDFVAEKRNEKIYVQVCYKLSDQSTADREFGPLLSVRDHYPKFVVSMDDFWKDNIEGVRHVYLSDFLTMDSY